MSTLMGRNRRRPPPAADPFRFGWREVPHQLPNGRMDYDRVPLTLEDVLHPQLGDVMPQAKPHDLDSIYLANVADQRLTNDPRALVGHDLQIIWEPALGLKPHSPDISIILGVRDAKKRTWTSFDVEKEAIRPRAFMEVVSPAYRVNDVVTKVEHYHRARVPWYYIVDRERDEGPVRLLGYQYKQRGYVPLSPDPDGWLWVEPLAIWLATRDNRVVCYDGDTEEEIGDYIGVVAKLEAETQARQIAERRADELAREVQELKYKLHGAETATKPKRRGPKRT